MMMVQEPGHVGVLHAIEIRGQSVSFIEEKCLIDKNNITDLRIQTL